MKENMSAFRFEPSVDLKGDDGKSGGSGSQTDNERVAAYAKQVAEALLGSEHKVTGVENRGQNTVVSVKSEYGGSRDVIIPNR